MQHHGGNLIHTSRDEFGPVEVVAWGDALTLHFGNDIQQSRLFLHNPDQLAFAYFRSMMTALCFQPRPQRALVLGLGGGILARFLFRHFSELHIDAVEYRETVAEAAYDYFQLPRDPRLQVHIADAQAYLRRTKATYDLVLVDLYDHIGMVDACRRLGFFDRVLQTLSADGVMAINLWRTDMDLYAQVVESLEAAFCGQLLYLPVGSGENSIAFAFPAHLPRGRMKALRATAEQLGPALEVDLAQLLRRLKQHNPHKL